MPFDPNNPPEQVHKLPANKQRQFAHVFNSAFKAGDDEETCFRKAWGVANKKEASIMNQNRELVLAAIALQTPAGRKGLAKQASAAPKNFDLLKKAGAHMLADPINKVFAKLLVTKVASKLTVEQLVKAARKAQTMQKIDAIKVASAIRQMPVDEGKKAIAQLPKAGLPLVKQAMVAIVSMEKKAAEQQAKTRTKLASTLQKVTTKEQAQALLGICKKARQMQIAKSARRPF